MRNITRCHIMFDGETLYVPVHIYYLIIYIYFLIQLILVTLSIKIFVYIHASYYNLLESTCLLSICSYTREICSSVGITKGLHILVLVGWSLYTTRQESTAGKVHRQPIFTNTALFSETQLILASFLNYSARQESMAGRVKLISAI